MKYFLLALMQPFFTSINAQMLPSLQPVDYTTVGTYSRRFTDVFCFTKNQGCLSSVKKTSVGLYSGRRFMLAEFKAFSAALSFPCWQGGAGVAASYTGFRDFNQSSIGIGYGKYLGEKTGLGAQLNYNRLSVAGYGSAAAVSFEIGAMFHLTEQVHLGVHAYNPVGGRFSNNAKEKLSSEYSLGLGYEVSDQLLLGTEIIKEEDRPVDFKLVLHYALEEHFFIRGGISGTMGNYFAGAGVSWKNFRLDIAADRHPVAGITPSLVLVFILSKYQPNKE